MKILIIGILMVLGISSQAGIFGSESVGDNVNSPEKDLDSVNGSITVGNDSHVDDLDTVNGSIKVGRGSTVGKVDTVNGSVKFKNNVTADKVEAVNGALVLGSGCMIKGHAETVNGSIKAGDGCEIQGKMETVNGTISAINSPVDGNIETTNGDIKLTEGTVVTGDVIISKSNGFVNSNKKVPTVIIGKNVVVEGDLIFKKKVKLSIHDSAKTGDISGDVERF